MKKLFYILPFLLFSCQDNIVEEASTIASDPTVIEFTTEQATRAYINEVTTFPVQAYVDNDKEYFFDTYTIGKGFPDKHYHFWPTKGQVGFFSVVGVNDVTYTPNGPIYSMNLQTDKEDVLVAEKWQSMDQGTTVALAYNHDLSRVRVDASIKNLPDGYQFRVDGVEFENMPMSGTREPWGWPAADLTYTNVSRSLITSITSEKIDIMPWFTVLPGHMPTKMIVHYQVIYPNGFIDVKTLDFDKVIKDGKEVPINKADLWYESGTGYVYTINFAVDATAQGDVDVPIYSEINFTTVVNPWDVTDYTAYTDPADAPSVIYKTFEGYYWDPNTPFVAPSDYNNFDTWLWWDPTFEMYEDMHYDNPAYGMSPEECLRSVLGSGSAVIRMYDNPVSKDAWYIWDNLQQGFKIEGTKVTCELKYVPLIEVTFEEASADPATTKYTAAELFTSNTGKISYHLEDLRISFDTYKIHPERVRFYKALDGSSIGRKNLLVLFEGSLYIVLPK